MAPATRRRVVINTSTGILGLGMAAVLIYPKVVALLGGTLAPLGLGAVANLALVFGSLMFLREAQRARRRIAPRPHDELESAASQGSLAE